MPAGTPTTTAIHVASSRAGWVHAALARTGEHRRAAEVPRGLSSFYLEIEDDFGAINFGGGNGQLDLESRELHFAN